jgi:hypothetical protein
MKGKFLAVGSQNAEGGKTEGGRFRSGAIALKILNKTYR